MLLYSLYLWLEELGEHGLLSYMATEKEVTAFAGCHFSSYLPHQSAYATSSGIGFRLLAPAMRRNAQLIIPHLPRPREAQCKWGCPNIASSWPRITKYRKRQNGMVISQPTLVHPIGPFLSYCRPLYVPPWMSQKKKIARLSEATKAYLSGLLMNRMLGSCQEHTGFMDRSLTTLS